MAQPNPFRTNHDERTALLAEPIVAVMSVDDPPRPPQASPLWFHHTERGTLEVHIAPGSKKAKLIEAAGAFSLCIQDQQPPYRYVTVHGPVTGTRPCDHELDARPMAHRYLGEAQGNALMDAQGPAGSIVIEMTPARWYGLDYGKAYGHLMEDQSPGQ